MSPIRLVLLCFVGLGFATAATGQLERVNSVILADIEDEIQQDGITKLQFVKRLVAGLEHSHSQGGGGVGSGIGIDACTVNETFNATLCSDILTNNCYDVTSLLTSATDSGDFDIFETFPSLVYHLYKPFCDNLEDEEHGHEEHKVPSSKAWGYGIAFCLAVCIISNIGGLMAPCMEKVFFQRILIFFVALAVGTLAATGFLVLVPESMHLTGDDSPVPDYNQKMATVMAGVYFFYTSEMIMKMAFDSRKRTLDREEVIGADQEKEKLENGRGNVGLTESREEHGHSHFPTSLKEAPDSGMKPVSTVAWMIMIGDALHNFVDGISIGAAFTENIPLGISVSIAILCEELPHELGDIAILLHAGLSMKRALLYNFLAAVVIIIGLVIGILVGENTDANSWVFAVAGGMFIYIALVDMLPEMRDQATKAIECGVETPLSAFLIQHLGLLVGFCIIASLVFFY